MTKNNFYEYAVTVFLGIIICMFTIAIITEPTNQNNHSPQPTSNYFPYTNNFNNFQGEKPLTNTNLAPINDGKWYTDASWQNCPASNVYYDTTTTHTGASTWRVQSGNNWGPDHEFIALHGGDHVFMSCWIKTSGTAAGEYTNIGARIGLDYYTANWQKRIMGCGSPTDASTGIGWPNVSRIENTSPACVVDYGSDWRLITWDFIVPTTAMVDNPLAEQGDIYTVGGAVPWMQVYGGNEYQNMQTSWFSDFQFYVNPTVYFNPNAGTYTSTQNIEILHTDEETTLYYTTDGSTPDDGDTEYTVPIVVSSGSVTIKAIGIRAGYPDTDVASGQFTITEDVSTSYFSDDVESGDLSAWTEGPWTQGAGSALTAQNALVHAGTWAVKSVLGAVADAYAVVGYEFASAKAILFLDAFVRFNALPADTNKLVCLMMVANDAPTYTHTADVYITKAGADMKWAAQYATNTGTAHVYSDAASILVDTWYEVTLKLIQGDVNGELAVWVDGNNVISLTGLSNDTLNNMFVYVGGEHKSGSFAVETYVDDVNVDSQYNGADPNPPSAIMAQLAASYNIINRRR